MKHYQRGDSLVEVALALAILALVLVSSYALATGSFRQGRGSGERTQAAYYLQEQAEALISLRDTQGWGVMTSSPAISGYAIPISATASYDDGQKFCLVRSRDTWRVHQITAGDATCNKSPYTLYMQAINADTVSGKKDKLSFRLSATWTDSGTQNHTDIVTQLTNPGARP